VGHPFGGCRGAAARLCDGARAACVWQANADNAQLANQADDYGQQLAEKDRINGLERERAAAVAFDRLLNNSKPAAPWKPVCGLRHKPTGRRCKMLDKLKLACVTGLLQLICGCQSSLTQEPSPARVVTMGCENPPAPEAWCLAPNAPNLTKRMLNELSPITYEGDRGLIALQAYQAYVREITNQQKMRAGKDASTSSPAHRTRRPILQV